MNLSIEISANLNQSQNEELQLTTHNRFVEEIHALRRNICESQKSSEYILKNVRLIKTLKIN